MTKARRIALCGVLTALALALSLAERMIPLQMILPIPGVKLGLANVVTMFALLFLKPRDAYAILLCRVCLAAIFAGSVTSFLFSLLGGLLALTTTWVLLRWKDRAFTMFGISAAAAAMHDIGQIMAAILVMGTTDVLAYLPLLLVSAIPMGLLTGAIIEVLSVHLKAIHFM